MIDDRRLLTVHAHPDDETITTGGLLARCADAGVSTCLAMCTDGRYGPVNPTLGLSLSPPELAEVRLRELKAASSILGIGEVVHFGYHDSGMAGASTGDRAQAFWSTAIDELVRQLVVLIRRFRPHVVVTYDAFGGTGHPDHIQAHRGTLLAVVAAAEERLMPDTGLSWQVNQLFVSVFPRGEMQRFIDTELAAGRPFPFDRDLEAINYLQDDRIVTHRVGIKRVYTRKRDALLAYATQVGPHNPQLYRGAMAREEHEHFRLLLSNEREKPLCADLFERVQP